MITTKKCLIGLFLMVFLLSACTAEKAAIEPIKIGVLVTSTGVGSYLGQQALRGLELAKDEINSGNGMQIKLIVEDTKTEPAAAVTAFEKLINVDNVKFVVGDSWSTTTVALVPIANQNQVLLISPIATLDSLSVDDLFFRTMPVTKDMMDSLAKYAYDDGIRTVGILRQETQYGQEHATDFRIAFEKLGGKVVGEESFDIKETDMRTQLTKINEKNPDAILNVHSSNMIGLVLKQGSELGFKAKWLSTFAAETSILLKDYSGVAEGLVYPYTFDANADVPSIKAFVAAYQARYDELPDNTAANSYDALKVLVKAISQNGKSPFEVKKALSNINNYGGASGVISFDNNGDVKKQIIIKQVKSGKFVKTG